MLCWGDFDLMDVRSGNAQIFTKTLVSVNFDPNAPKSEQIQTLKIKQDFEAPGIYIYIIMRIPLISLPLFFSTDRHRDFQDCHSSTSM